MKAWIWSAAACAAAFVGYMVWREKGLKLEARGRLGQVRVRAASARRSRRKPALARG